jgi:hypothetical protein
MLRRLALIAALALSSAMAAPQAARAQMDPRDLEICKQQCLSRASSHADPRYTSCVRSRCQGQPARRSSGSTQRKSAPRTSASAPAAAAAAGALAIGAWGLATHEALGAGVHTQSDQGVIGLSCAPEGVALRATNGLFRGPVLGWITDTGSAGGSIPLTPGAAYSESRGAACALGVAGLGSASALILVDVPVTARGPGAGFALDLPGGPVAVMSGAEVQARLPGTRSLPAQGLASGLAALAASCPALAEALRSPCP